MYIVHQDIVKPSKVAEYEKAAKGWHDAAVKNAITELAYVLVQSDEMVYSYVSEVPNMAALDDNGPMDALKQKMGEAAFQAMFDAYDGTYTSHKNFMITYRPDLSYLPEKQEATAEINFRHWDFVHFNPDKEKEANAISKEWVDLFASKQIQLGFRTYTGGLGTETPLTIWVSWSKNAADFYAAMEQINKTLGDEGTDLWNRTLAITDKYEQVNGRIRPDLSYQPAAEELSAK